MNSDETGDSNLDETELEKLLDNARCRLDDLTSGNHQLPDRNAWGSAFHEAYDEVLDAERNLAQARGEPCALACSDAPKPDIGAPMPQLLTGEDTFLIYYASAVDPAWDGTYVNIVNPLEATATPVVLIRFKACLSAKMGSPNDEVIEGHPLHGRGLQAYAAHIVANSPWIAEIQKINSVHRSYSPDRWKSRRHYLFFFHDETFECIAEGFDVELHHASLETVFKLAADRMFER